MKVFIIGLGLIGGSLAKSLRKSAFADEILGFDKAPENLSYCIENHIIDRSVEILTGAQEADIIILATPVDGIIELMPLLLNQLQDQVVVDMGSTKRAIVELAAKHPKGKNFVAAHPMAGIENSGPAASFEQLFTDKVAIICNPEQNDRMPLNLAKLLFKSLNMKLIFMDANEHDRDLAYLSHLSHILSFSLALTAYNVEDKERNIFNLAGGGFASTVRLAGSSAAMWNPVFLQNKANMLEALELYISNLELFKMHIQNEDKLGLNQLMEKSNAIYKIINQSL
ncbi:MAG TPA: prephenate dehydrogenase [Bacteroidales bacterium]|nr:prephenate dehydrogenase [Bacteroidales bacterium]